MKTQPSVMYCLPPVMYCKIHHGWFTTQTFVYYNGLNNPHIPFQLKAILDESALGTQTISAATTDTTAAQLTSTQTAITAIQAKVDAIIDGTISSCS